MEMLEREVTKLPYRDAVNLMSVLGNYIVTISTHKTQDIFENIPLSSSHYSVDEVLNETRGEY
jgi:hypothetical protein